MSSVHTLYRVVREREVGGQWRAGSVGRSLLSALHPQTTVPLLTATPAYNSESPIFTLDYSADGALLAISEGA